MDKRRHLTRAFSAPIFQRMSDWSEDVPHVCSAACIQSPAETLALLQDAHTLIWRARSFAGYGAGPLAEPFAEMVERRLKAAKLAPALPDAETLALIAEHRLSVQPVRGNEWAAWTQGAMGEGHTIGDAVRACVARIKDAGR